MATLTIKLFGRFGISVGGEALEQLEASKAQELLCYLLLHRERPQAREALADVLWGESAGPQAKKHLRQAIWKLHTVLDAREERPEHRLLLVDPGWISLNPQADLWLDVAIFTETAARVEGIPGQSLTYDASKALQEAVELYRGDFLADWYEDWCVCERERLQNIQLLLLTKLIAYWEAHGGHETGIAYGNRVLQVDRAHERTHRALMRLHYCSGDRTAALRQYSTCCQALQEELGVPPAASTVALYDCIRADRLESTVPQTMEPGERNTTYPFDGMRDSLALLEATLLDFQDKVRRLREEMDVVARIRA